jgi:hypothetical protein
MNKRKVFVVSKIHDCSEAESYGELVYLTEGVLNPYAIGSIAKQMKDIMADSSEGDWLLLNGLPTAQCIAVAIMASKYSTINLLMYRKGKYIERYIETR